MADALAQRRSVGLVAIGRNEGERLVRCLRSIASLQLPAVVYVDSGSSDGSASVARAHGARVVELDPTRPFSAARARNEGFRRLREELPDVSLVQFVDGDCELQAGWIDTGCEILRRDASVAAVVGRRREREPGASVYNRLADLEWDTPVGDAVSFGGDVLIRASVFEEVGGYRESLIAGEDPDFSLRIRSRGWRIVRLDAEMTLHDANLRRLSEFWRRQVRTGHAYAELLSLHGAAGDPRSLRAVRSAAFWGGLVPAAGLLGAWPTRGASLAFALAALALLAARIALTQRRRGRPPAHAALYALGCVLGKVAELRGAATFAVNRWIRGTATGLIEYK
jgi:hypothetical protein